VSGIEITGPELRDFILRRCFDRDDGPGYVTYRYEDGEHRASTEWASSLVRVRAYFMSTSPDRIARLHDRIVALSGCVEATRVENHVALRPMVEARFDRRAAAVQS
jgi:hypothetical protein